MQQVAQIPGFCSVCIGLHPKPPISLNLMPSIEIDRRGCQAYFCRFYLCSLCWSTTKQPSSHQRRTRLWLHLYLIVDGWDMGKTVWGVPAWHSSESITKTTPGKQWLGPSRCPRLNNNERHQTPDKGTFQMNLLDIKHVLHIFLFDVFFLNSAKKGSTSEYRRWMWHEKPH